MKRILNIYAALTALMLSGILCTAIPSKPSPQRLVNDLAGIFTAEQRHRLENALVAFDDSTSNQITVVTVSDLEGYTPSEYATRIGLDWKVGREDFDNGIVVLVKPKTADSRGETAISIGYGLEGAIPDAYAKRIIENEMIPHFRENDYYSGVASACVTLMQLASGEISEPRDNGEDGSLPGLSLFAIFILVGMTILFAMISSGKNGGNNNGRGGGYRDDDDIAKAIIIGSLLGGGRGGSSGWGGSGGGFSSGGFGGFGGGSFGGGGASGSW